LRAESSLREREACVLARLAPLLHGRTQLVVGDRLACAADSRWPDLPVSLDLPRDVYPSDTYPLGKLWPYGDGSMDVVLWFHVHEWWEPRKTLFEESVRVLNPGGQIVILGFHPLWSRLLRSRITGAGVEPCFHPVQVGWLKRRLAQSGFGVRTRLYGARWPGALDVHESAAQDSRMEFGVPLVYALLAVRQSFVSIPQPELQPVADSSRAPIILPSRRVA